MPKMRIKLDLNQATGMTKISRGYFRKFFGQGVFNRKSRFLALLSLKSNLPKSS